MIVDRGNPMDETSRYPSLRGVNGADPLYIGGLPGKQHEPVDHLLFPFVLVGTLLEVQPLPIFSIGCNGALVAAV